MHKSKPSNGSLPRLAANWNANNQTILVNVMHAAHLVSSESDPVLSHSRPRSSPWTAGQATMSAHPCRESINANSPSNTRNYADVPVGGGVFVNWLVLEKISMGRLPWEWSAKCQQPYTQSSDVPVGGGVFFELGSTRTKRNCLWDATRHILSSTVLVPIIKSYIFCRI